jgi:hypothetical protein
VVLLELGTVLLAFGGMAGFFAWTAELERRRARAAGQELLRDRSTHGVLVVELDAAPTTGAAVRRTTRISRAA